MAFLLNKTFWALYCNMIGKHQETSSVANCIFVCNGLFRVTEISQPKDHLWIFGQQCQLQKWGSFKGGYLLFFSSLHLPSPSPSRHLLAPPGEASCRIVRDDPAGPASSRTLRLWTPVSQVACWFTSFYIECLELLDWFAFPERRSLSLRMFKVTKMPYGTRNKRSISMDMESCHSQSDRLTFSPLKTKPFPHRKRMTANQFASLSSLLMV